MQIQSQAVRWKDRPKVWSGQEGSKYLFLLDVYFFKLKIVKNLFRWFFTIFNFYDKCFDTPFTKIKPQKLFFSKFCALVSCSSADEGDSNIDPTHKAIREKERRQANNVRERYVNWALTLTRTHYSVFCHFFYPVFITPCITHITCLVHSVAFFFYYYHYDIRTHVARPKYLIFWVFFKKIFLTSSIYLNP